MKAVILAGGLGTRMREETEFKPKPMVEVGGKPVLWHIMKILSQQGINDFVVCVGYRGDVIRDYFWNFPARSSDFTVSLDDGEKLVHDGMPELRWNVTVAETGPLTPTGGRIHQIKRYVEGDDNFLITYGDGIAPVQIGPVLETHLANSSVLTLSTCRPRSRFGVVEADTSGLVRSFREKPEGSELVNIGYMIASQRLFDFLDANSTLENEPLETLCSQSLLSAVEHRGFWQPMDTQREAQILNSLWESGDAPWRTWN